MLRLLGFADIIAGFLFVASFYQVALPRGLMIAIGAYLILKGLLFIASLSFFSLIDIGAGILLAFGLVSGIPAPVLLGLAVILGVKGLASLFVFS